LLLAVVLLAFAPAAQGRYIVREYLSFEGTKERIERVGGEVDRCSRRTARRMYCQITWPAERHEEFESPEGSGQMVVTSETILETRHVSVGLKGVKFLD
jgi:hypothetical protein